jgi:hypothetical protein
VEITAAVMAKEDITRGGASSALTTIDRPLKNKQTSDME